MICGLRWSIVLTWQGEMHFFGWLPSLGISRDAIERRGTPACSALDGAAYLGRGWT
jgi:hypothetical protein